MFGFFKKGKQKKELIALIQDALSDDKLTEDEYGGLLEKAKEFNIDKSIISDLREKHFLEKIKPIKQQILDEAAMSPEQEESIVALAKNLHVSHLFDSDFILCRTLWKFQNDENFEPTPFDASHWDIILQSGEMAYTYTHAVWEQLKKKKISHGFAGGSLSFRVAKGVRLSVGRAVPISQEYEEMTEIAGGILVVTNKRILLNGDRRNTNITKGRLVSYEVFEDGIEIRKSTGQPDFFRMGKIDTLFVAAMIQSVLVGK